MFAMIAQFWPRLRVYNVNRAAVHTITHTQCNCNKKLFNKNNFVLINQKTFSIKRLKLYNLHWQARWDTATEGRFYHSVHPNITTKHGFSPLPRRNEIVYHHIAI